MSSLKSPEFIKRFQPAFPVGYNEQGYLAKFLGYSPDDPMFVPQLVFVDRKCGIIRVQYSGDEPTLAQDMQESKPCAKRWRRH